MYRCAICNGPLGTGDFDGICSSCKSYKDYPKYTPTDDNYCSKCGKLLYMRDKYKNRYLWTELDELKKQKEDIEKRIKELENNE